MNTAGFRGLSFFRRFASALLALALLVTLLPPAAAAEIAVTPVEASGPPPFINWPAQDSEGYLAMEWLEDEFVHIDEEAGRWVYLSHDLRILIERFHAVHQKRKLVYFIADIRFRGDQAFRAFLADPKNPARVLERPAVIARKNKVVYAQNGDLFSYRYYNKKKMGLIIRGGKVISKDTYTRALAAIPPLDELALYPNGHVEMSTPGINSPQDYLNRGATDVLAFGPILFQHGRKDDRLDKSFTHREPRSALGVIKPGHFVGIMVEGRNERSVGANLQFVADRLIERGCVEAFTLDGGQTAAMVFMGQEIMDPGIYSGFQQARRQQDIIGIGISPKVTK
ncbi:MAG: phosphodiester glycosidase family protein [Clostridiales bacterium]|nr:phosphodiester glycosidase family protein [Clostridiales bacterium]